MRILLLLISIGMLFSCEENRTVNVLSLGFQDELQGDSTDLSWTLSELRFTKNSYCQNKDSKFFVLLDMYELCTKLPKCKQRFTYLKWIGEEAYCHKMYDLANQASATALWDANDLGYKNIADQIFCEVCTRNVQDFIAKK